MRIHFCVEPKRIYFFARLFKKNLSPVVINEAQKSLFFVKKNWDSNIFFIEKALDIFRNIHLERKIIVSVFPEDFLLGAVEPSEQLILYGQPSKSKNFSSAIITHEISHIFLSKIKIPRHEIIDEIICFLIENQIYLWTERKNLKDIWKIEELNLFHRKALQTALKYVNDFKVKDKGIQRFILCLERATDKKILAIKRPKGLIENLKF